MNLELMKALFPDTTYGVESGGDPKVIPQLTYENFLEFHRTYYSPANSYIYLYGDMDMGDMLTYLDKAYLSSFDIIPVDSEIGVQKATGFKKVQIPYSVSEDEDTEDKAYLEYGVKLFDGPEYKKALAWEILASILFSIPGAPVKKALLDAGIGNDVSGQYMGDQRQPILTVTARETSADKADEFLRIIRDTVADIAAKGVNRRSILAALNRAEFSFREADFGGYPKGIVFGFTSLSAYLYDETAALKGLDRGWVFDELRKDLETGYFEELLRDFLATDHAALVVMTPEPGLATKEEEALAAELAARKASMSEAEIDEGAQGVPEPRGDRGGAFLPAVLDAGRHRARAAARSVHGGDHGGGIPARACGPLHRRHHLRTASLRRDGRAGGGASVPGTALGRLHVHGHGKLCIPRVAG